MPQFTTEEALLQQIMERLVIVLPGCAIALIVAPPFDAPKDARANWISNSSRADMVVLLKEMIARFEGRRPDDTSERPQ